MGFYKNSKNVAVHTAQGTTGQVKFTRRDTLLDIEAEVQQDWESQKVGFQSQAIKASHLLLVDF